MRPRHPADAPTIDEIVAVIRHTGDDRLGRRLREHRRLWRTGFASGRRTPSSEHDLDARRGSLLVRSGKSGSRREVGSNRRTIAGIDAWNWFSRAR